MGFMAKAYRIWLAYKVPYIMSNTLFYSQIASVKTISYY